MIPETTAVEESYAARLAAFLAQPSEGNLAAAYGIDCPVREPIQPVPHPRTPAPNNAPKRPGIASWKRPLIIRMPAKIKPPKQMTAPA